MAGQSENKKKWNRKRKPERFKSHHEVEEKIGQGMRDKSRKWIWKTIFEGKAKRERELKNDKRD